MRFSCCNRVQRWRFLLPLLALAGVDGAYLRGADSSPAPGNPRYVLKLNLNEYSIFNASYVDGLLKYGGSGDFKLQMAKEGNEVAWTVTIDNPRIMELLGIFVGEKTVKLVQGLDAASIDPSERLALQTIKSLSQKMDYARTNPVWDKVKLSGVVIEEGTNWLIQTQDEKLKLVGDKVPELKSKREVPLVAEGYVKAPGLFEPTRCFEKRLHTLELFVMSLCPFAQRAETSLYAFLSQARTSAAPSLEIHYLFYKTTKEDKDAFGSLHGEEEVVEDLVQMALRDRYPQFFQGYVLFRAKDAKTNWQELARQLGLKADDIAALENAITTQRDQMIRKEYDYTTGRYGIADISPSYVWESEAVADLRKIEAFKGMSGAPQEACAK